VDAGAKATVRAAASAPAGAPAGPWAGRPSGVPGSVPPPSVPLAFLAVAAVGLVACGIAWALVAGQAAVDPTADEVVAAAHLGMLATLSMGVLGAMHQFVPVVTQRPLRSTRLARATLAAFAAACALLPLGFSTGVEDLVEAGGGLAAVAVALAVANLAAPLAARGRGAPVAGLRTGLAGFVATACFGVVYVADRRAGWFDLSGHVVLAHAVVGLFGWLGLVYVSVAEKLWPMFFLAHLPGRHRVAWLAVSAVPAGAALLAPGLLLRVPAVAWTGAALLALGLGAHLASLAAHLRRRRRRADLHLLFVVTSACWLVAGAALGLDGALAGSGGPARAFAAASVAAIAGWLLVTLVGHAHKVVPFIAWSALRARGVARSSAGRPLLFADLYGHVAAALTYLLVNGGVAALCAGLAARAPAATAVGGSLLAASGLLGALNLSWRPTVLAARASSGERTA